MKNFILLIISLSVSSIGFSQTFPVETVQKTGDNNHRVVYVFLGDGYMETELGDYASDVQNVYNDLFNKAPFKQYRNFFNIYRIDVPSEESGADHPGTATDVTEPAHEVKEVQTKFGCTFDWGRIHRLLVAANSGEAFLILALNTASYDQGFILSNSPHYGGSGGILATSSTHSSASEISIHEIGHSFAGLWDEYWNGSGNEYPNMTRETDPTKVKWAHWLGIDGVGIYPYGTSNPQAEWNRPHQNCEMRLLNREFCAVCKEQIIKSIYELAPPLESTTPKEGQLIHLGEELTFLASIVYPEPNSLEISWELNGEVYRTNIDSVLIPIESLSMDFNILTLTVTETTDMVRDPAANLLYRRTWTLLKDLDNDGFISEEDCDDTEALINPDAQDIPNNGIDEDCDGEDATTTSVSEINSTSVKIFPNPSQGELNFQTNISIDGVLSITDVTGKTVFTKKIKLIEREVYSLELDSRLSNGIYTLNIVDNKANTLITEVITISY